MVYALSNNEPLADDGRISGDAALMSAAARGNDGAWAAIVSANLPIVHRTAYRLVRDDQLAEDIAQESFVRLWKLAESWQPRGRISTWLCHVARNLAIDVIRRRAREQSEMVSEDLAADGPTPLETMAARETDADVERAIAALPERQRIAIRLIHFGDCTGQAAAEIMGVSVEALESLLSRARRSLKAALSRKREA
ncbi:MAG: sigma-70 family RNA polymerase sigma factor [Proteobacteria bacterium]|nr:sigma-70 family RNA polymerase sigma factor [Pseudomonadota bacterium]